MAKPRAAPGGAAVTAKGGAARPVIDLPTAEAGYRKKLAESDISLEAASYAGVKVLRAPEAERLGLSFLGTKYFDCIGLPYHDRDGKPTGFWRARVLLELVRGFDKVTLEGGRQKYTQPKGSVTEVYLPRVKGLDWGAVLAGPAVPLVITEGEFKALAATLQGVLTVGLGGVDAWRSGKLGLDLFPVLRDAEWKGRQVTVIFDNDLASNPNVMAARLKLARALAGRGALVEFGTLPFPGPKGLDDYLVAHGVDALKEEIIAKAAPFAEGEALHELNTEVVYVKDPGLVVEIGSGYPITPSAFVSHTYANRHVLIETAQGQKRKPLAKHWIEWPNRNEVARMTYRPQGPSAEASKFFEVGGEREFNRWRGWGVLPTPGDTSPWRELLDYAFTDRPAERDWFEKWCAYPLQNPGTKMFTSVVVWGVHHGTGKTLIGYTLRDIYGRNAIEIKDADLRNPFNEWAIDKQFVIGDEVTGSDKRGEADRIKGMITQENTSINKKNVPTYSVPDCMNYYFNSNHPDAFFLEDTDRRFFVHEVTGTPLPQAFYDRYDNWLKQGNGPAHLFDYLLKLDLKGFNPRAHAPMTAAKQAMIADGKSDVGAWVMRLREDPDGALGLVEGAAAEGCDLFTPSQLRDYYDPVHETKVTAGGLGRELKRSGFRQVYGGRPVDSAVGPVRLYAVRNPDKWLQADHAQVVEHYDAFFKPKAKKF